MISKLPRWVWAGGGILAFNAGVINAIAFLGFAHQAATHVTGLFSHLSIALFQLDTSQIELTSFVILSFFSGAIISGMILRDAQLKIGGHYSVTLILECLLLVFSTLGFRSGSPWGEYFASMAAGLQNAMVSTYSGAIVRTTHLTGILTDLGVLIGNALRGLPVDIRRISLLLILIISFLLGGLLGTFLYTRFAYMAMFCPALIIGILALGYQVIQRQK